jgi:ubiquinone/menaquinone biosynthesis C-methylase UbiE
MAFDPDAYTADSRRNWHAVAPHYAKMSAKFSRPITAPFLEFCAPKRTDEVLDVACGPGTLTGALAGKAGRVLGVDLAEGMLAEARKSVPGAEFRAMNAESLDLPDASFDLVACQLGLMLFAKPEAALREFVRVAKPGGSVACLVQGTKEGMQFTSLLMRAIVAHAPELKTPGAPVLFAFGPDGVLAAALSAANLSDVESRRVSGTLPFESEQAYWDEMLRGAGRTGAMLRTLDAGRLERVRADVWASLARFKDPKGALAVPFEVVMARGAKKLV